MSKSDHIVSETSMITPDLYTGEPPLQSAHNTWARVRNDLAYALGANVHRSWTGRLRVSSATERIVTLSAPTRFIASKIETQYAETVRRLWKKHDMVAPPRDIMFSAAAGAPISPPKTNTRKFNTPSSTGVDPLQKQALTSKPLKNTESPRDRFTFDNFVVGASNELAFAVARQIASCRAAQYNPIVCLLYTSPSPRDATLSRMPSSA